MHHQLQGRLRRAPEARGQEDERDNRACGRHSPRYNQVVPRRRHQTGARHHDSRGLSYSRSIDENLVSATPRPTSQRPLPERRRYGIADHEQKHYSVLVSALIHEDSPA